MLRTLVVALAFCALCSTAVAAPFGASDNAFSGDGWLTLTGGHDYEGQASAVELQADRKIVSGGSAVVGGLTHFALTRHTVASGLDTTFGEQGKVIMPIGNSGNAAIVDLEILPGTGTILALGNARNESEPRIALARYTPAGVLDGSFGAGGKVVDELLSDGATATAMARTADGSILVTGQIREGAAQKVFLRRFSANGTPESLRTYTLGDTGCATAARIFARPDGSIIIIGALCKPFTLAGATYGPDGYVLKLDANGLRRGDFGVNGMLTSAIPEARFSGGIVDSQGRFVLYGASRLPYFGSYRITTALARLTADGAADPSFGGGDGVTTIVDQDITFATDVDELADGRLWLTAAAQVGSAPILGAWGFGLIGADGTPVAEYGFRGSGAQAVQIGSAQTSNAESAGQSVIDTDGATQTLVTAGRASTTVYGGFLTENRTFGLRRFSLPKGNAVAPYNSYSGSSTPVGETVEVSARRLRTLPDDGLLAAGDVTEVTRLRMTAWKLGADGTPDASFGTGGVASPIVGSLGSRANDIAPAPGGGYYMVGEAQDATGYDTLALVKLTPAGTLDGTFGTGGAVLQRLRPTTGAGAAPVCTATPPICFDNDGTAGSGGEGIVVIPLADGVLVAGSAGTIDGIRGGAAAYRVVLARYTTAGLPYPGFGTNGIVQLYRNGNLGGNQRPFAATLRGASKLLIAAVLGDSSAFGPVSELQVDLATGALDPTFSDDGYAEAPVPTSYSRTAMRFVGATDTLVIGGYTSASPFPPTPGRFAGALAPLAGFGTNGFATVPVTGASAITAYGVDLLPSGTLVHGVGLTSGSPRSAAVIGVGPDGQLVGDFGNGGLLATARSCGGFTTQDVSVDGSDRLLVAGVGADPALGNVASLARFTAGTPSAPVPCPPTSGFAGISGPDAGPLTCTPSSFSGATPHTYAYEWVRESTVIAGATSNTYALTAEDAGHLLACRVRGSNAYGAYRTISAARRAPGTIVIEPEPTATPDPGPAGGDPGPGTTQTPATQQPGPKPGATTTPLPAIKASAVFTLPSNKKCASRRSFRIRLKAPKGVKLASATVRVNNKLVQTVKGKRLTAPVDLRGLPKGKFTVKVEAKTTDGRVVRDTRTYKTCMAGNKQR